MGDPLDDHVHLAHERRLFSRVAAWAAGELGELELDDVLADDDRSQPVAIPLELLRRIAQRRS